MPLRGTYNFEVNNTGDILYSENNIELLRKLWLDREVLTFEELGPGDPGDFDFGAWHIACHLVAACGVRKANNGNLIWLEISYNPDAKLYEPTLTTWENNIIKTILLGSAKAQDYLKDSELLGFVEGTSEGRISAQGVIDDKDFFNKNPRQEYNQEPGNDKDGGRVWEHWCTTRDIRTSSSIGSSALSSYIALTAACSDKFAPTVARGRTDYYHPIQLKALVKAGFTSPDSTQLKINPTVIPENISLMLQGAKPEVSFLAIEKLDWSDPLKYYMFERRMDRWNENVIL